VEQLEPCIQGLDVDEFPSHLAGYCGNIPKPFYLETESIPKGKMKNYYCS
jgi:hypothetical protein